MSSEDVREEKLLLRPRSPRPHRQWIIIPWHRAGEYAEMAARAGFSWAARKEILDIPIGSEMHILCDDEGTSVELRDMRPLG